MNTTHPVLNTVTEVEGSLRGRRTRIAGRLPNPALFERRS